MGEDAAIGGPRGEDTEGGSETETKKEMMNYEKVMALVREYFGEEHLA